MKKLIIFIFLNILCTSGFAFDKSIEIGIGLARPPFIMEDQKTGIELEILSNVLENAKIKYKFEILPQARLVDTLLKNEVEAIITQKELPSKEYYISDDYITFQNVAVSKKIKNLNISHVKDLMKFNVAAFQNASTYLGKDFVDVSIAAKSYKEYPAQKDQVHMLFSDRVDVIVLEKNIFLYHLKLRKELLKDYEIKEIFAKNNYHVVFKDKSIRDRFNKSLSEFKKSSAYKKLFQKYLN